MNGGRSRPLLLDTFCKAGGAGAGYHRAGFDVVGVDIEPQPHYPFEFHRAEAVEFIRAHGGDFTLIHGSPPCQAHLNLTRLNETLGRQHGHEDLIADTRAAMVSTGRPYVIENVQDAHGKLIDPVRVCGTAFELPLRRHRLFESSLPVEGIRCEHSRFTEPRYWTGWSPGGQRTLSTVVQVYGNAGGKHEWPAAMGIDWMSNEELCEAIPPVYTEHIGAQLIEHLQERAA